MLVTDGYRDGDIVLVRARWWLPQAMHDHAALLWQWPHDEVWYTVEAGLTGVRDYVAGHWPRPFGVYRPDKATAEQGLAAVSHAMSLRGTRYAWEHLPAVLWRIIRRPMLAHAVVCTGFVAESWAAAGVELCPGVRSPSPDDIWRAVK